MRKLLLSLVSVCAFACAAAVGDEPKISVFASFIRDVSRERAVTPARAAEMLYALGVRGYDCSPDDSDFGELAATCLRPINFYYFPNWLERSADGSDRTTPEECLAKAKRCGVPRVMVVPPDFTDGRENEREFAVIVGKMREFVAAAKKVGVTVTVEDFGGTANCCSYAKYLKRLLTEVPGLKFALDSGNLYYAGRGEDILEMMDFAKGRIGHVHLKDQTASNNRKYATLGLGAVPNERIVKSVAASGYDGWWTLENPVGDTYNDTIRQISLLRAWLAEAASRRGQVPTVAVAVDVLDELLPRPRRLKRLFGGIPAKMLGASCACEVVRGPVDGAPAERQEESYVLRVTDCGVSIRAGGRLGELHARSTLEQLSRLAGSDGVVPAFEISDWPELALRGVMLDTGRNYVDVASLRDLIDHLALYKMNVFHWHITDYHGWRLESKRYPQLNGERATTRFPTGIYTQEEFRGLVDYAWERGVTVIPELDVPGHTRAFRLGLGVEKMREPKVRGVILDLIDELCSLVPAERMPYVHLGTDEVDQERKGGYEWVPKEWITAWAERVAAHGRVLIGWKPGEKIEMKGRQLKEIWGWVEYHHAKPTRTADYGAEPYVDSTEFHYINHIDPFEVLNSAAFQKPCPWGPDANRRGVMISAWHDDATAESGDYFRQVPVFPAVTMYSDAFWLGRREHRPLYLSHLPKPGTEDFDLAADLERRAVAQRDRVLAGLRHPFPYVAQTAMRWRLSAADGRVVATDIPQATVYPNRTLFRGSYFAGREGTAVLETWIRSPVAQNLGCWIGATAFARSGGREVDGPVPQVGQWNRHGATVELNGVKVAAPAFKNAGLAGKGAGDTPMVDEEYYLRPPLVLPFKAGWNHVKLTLPKGPQTDAGQKWVGTFVPVAGTSERPREVPGLEFSSSPR